jgi:endonuclease-3
MQMEKQDKQPFDAEKAFALLDKTMQAYPKAGLFQLSDEGYTSLFQQLVACIISIRTLDEVMIPAARRLFAKAGTPAEVSELTPEEIEELIQPAVFHTPKSHQIHAIAERAVREYAGNLPCEETVLRSFSGVGPKCANLALGIACGQALISVDIHVHRVVNRWGIVQTRAPEETQEELETLLPHGLWIETNRLLMPFGKFVCTGKAPHCSTCPLLEMCKQVGVTEHR